MTRFSIAAALALATLALGPQDAALAQPRDCPPGLAKKDPPCVPPGLARKGVRADDDDGHRRVTGRDRDRDRDDVVIRDGDDVYVLRRDRDGDLVLARRDDGTRLDRDRYVIGADGRIYRVGERIDPDDYVLIRAEDLARLPLLRDGHRYVRVDDRIVEIAETTNLFVRTVGAVSDLLN